MHLKLRDQQLKITIYIDYDMIISGTGEPGGLLSMGLHRVGHD